LAGKPEGKIPLRRPLRTCEDNMRIDLIGKSGGKVWTGFIWLRIGTSGELL
jgi:hypothetical protein